MLKSRSLGPKKNLYHDFLATSFMIKNRASKKKKSSKQVDVSSASLKKKWITCRSLLNIKKKRHSLHTNFCLPWATCVCLIF